MKKIAFAVAILMCLVTAGCSSARMPQESSASDAPILAPDITPESTPAVTPSPQPTQTPSFFAAELSDLPEEYAREDAIANGDYVYTGRGYANEEKMTALLDAVAAKKSAAIRITRYTDEGDPIIADVVFDGSKFTVQNDTTRDKFGPQALTQSEYLYMLEHENQGTTFLILTKEAEMTDELFQNNPDQFLLKFWKDEE